MKNDASYDAIVIGAGHNGLAAAAVLAGKGKRTLVLERNASIGGMMAAGVLDGIEIPRFSHLLYNLNPTVAREIALHIDAKPLPTVALSSDLRHVVTTSGKPQFADGSAHPDAAAYQALYERMVRYGGLLSQLSLSAPPKLAGPGKTRELIGLARLGLKLRLMGKGEMREFLRVLLSNAQDLILDVMPDGPLAGALAADAVRGAFSGPTSPGTVFSLIYRLAQGGDAALPSGGMPAVAWGFMASATSRGAEVRTGVGVARLNVENDRVTGLELEDGTRLAAPIVLSTAGALETMQLAGVNHFDIEASRRLRNLRAKGSAAKVNLILEKAPEIQGLSATQCAGRLLVAPSVRAVERAFNPVKYGEASETPIIEAVISTLTTPDPSGMHVLSAVVQFVPHSPAGGWTKRARTALEKRVVATLEQFAPGLKATIRASELLTPADIEAETGAPGGHWHHGEMGFDQLLTVRPANGMSRYAMGPKGLYLAGASAHPGGDITGAPGRNAAKTALADGGAT